MSKVWLVNENESWKIKETGDVVTNRDAIAVYETRELAQEHMDRWKEELMQDLNMTKWKYEEAPLKECGFYGWGQFENNEGTYWHEFEIVEMGVQNEVIR